MKFGCKHGFFDCRVFRFLRKIIVLVFFAMTLVFIMIAMIFCRRVLRKKMDNEIDIQVKSAVQKYLVVEKE